MNNNIFTTLLRYINVPFTEKYASEAYFFQPYRNTMYGLMQLLNKYKINNECIEFADKADVFQSTMPCIIVYDDKFYILKGFIGDKVIIISRTGKETNIKCSDFLAAWNGIALTLHPNRQSTEPNIKAHHKSEIIASAKSSILCFCCLIFVVVSIFANSYNNYIYWYLLIINNLTGIYISFMLLQKQLKIKNNIANKLCSLVNDKCEKVTDSNGGKIWGLATLSEVGFAFFFVNVVILILYSKAITSVGLFSFIVLPFSFWSLWYQKFVAKSWCVLCLLCLILMWFQALIFFFSGLMSSIVIDVIPFVIVCLSYIGVSLVLNKLTGVFKDRYSAIHWHLRYNGLKYDDRILKAIQQGAQKFDVSSENCSSLVFGNANAKRNITIFSNPFCNPCSELHELIKDYPGDNVSVRYSMTAFSEELTVINRYIIAAYQQLGPVTTWKLLGEWYKYGKEQDVNFFSKYDLNIEDNDVESELKKQLEWRKNKSFYGTPTVIINGVQLAEPYTVEDYNYWSI